MKPDSNRLAAIDAAAILAISIAICLASKNLLFMTVFVPVVILFRIIAIAAIAKQEGVNLWAEFLFLFICTVLGAFNDWNSVCKKGIYEYTVPHYFDFSTIPVWMLIYWGMILRFFARLARWQALGPGYEASNRIGVLGRQVESAAVKIILEILIVLLTRRTVYRYYADPLWSWLPFLIALGAVLFLFKSDRHDLKLLGIFLIVGPLIEILYINVGGLHHYHLGWIGGVPLWIVLWWSVMILIWKDLAFRIEKALRALLS